MSKILPAFALSFAISFFTVLALIKILNGKKAYAALKPELLVQDKRKARTPFFGGIAFVVAITICCAIFLPMRKSEVLVPLIALWCFSIAGFVDDWLKLSSDNGDGLNVKQKAFSQVAAGCVTYLLASIRTDSYLYGFNLLLFVLSVGYMFYYVNALNITDGVDGLSSVSTLAVIVALIAVFKPDSDTGILCWITGGAILGFFCFNKSPAKIFMGDVGSHGLGGLIAAIAIVGKAQLTVLIASTLFFIEFMSSFAQILSIRLRKKKLFPIAPLHHWAEKTWSPWKIVIVFSSVNVVFSIIAVLMRRLWS